MKAYAIAPLAVGALALLAIACENVSGLDNAPRATFAQLQCLDVNGDNAINGGDAADPSKLPDFNADDARDADDAAFLNGVEIPLDPNRDKSVCNTKTKKAPEYLVAHGYFDPSDVSCDEGERAVLLVGVGGGLVNLRDDSNAAGVRSIVDGMQKAYDDEGVQTIGIISGPSVEAALNRHGGMEEWLTHAVRVYLDRFPCAQVVLVGHSHGAVTAAVVASRLEGDYAARFVGVVAIDRFVSLYDGDTASRPTRVPVLNFYETNDPTAAGAPYESPNAENVDVSGETAPGDGEAGGEIEPLDHTTIDNSDLVKERSVDWAMQRSQLAFAE